MVSMKRDSIITLLHYPLVGAFMLLLFGCAGSSQMEQPASIEPPPPAEATAPVIEEEIPQTLHTLEEILGPISFDPDTVRAGRFDTGRMWLFEAPPIDWFAEAYGFTPDEAWFAKARSASLRNNGGECSSSFVSPNGLIFTNHHCGRSYVTQVTREGENLLEEGFYAPTLAEERPIEGFFIDQIVDIIDVSARVHAAMDAVENPAAKQQARDNEIEAIQTEFDAQNGMVNEIVELFNGGRYSVYTFKRYTDVRLVMAPELEIGYFGGDPDNFTYPRYNLDITFMRVYEDGEPVDSSGFYYPWSIEGAEAGDPVFVVGNPGNTSRLSTVAQLAHFRDYQYAYTLHMLETRMKALRTFLDEHPDLPDWEVQNNFWFNISNGEKSFRGRMEGLLDPWTLARKAAWEEEFRRAVVNDPVLFEQYGDPWTEIGEAYFDLEPYAADLYVHRYTNIGDRLSSVLLGRAFLLQQYRFLAEQGMAASNENMQDLRQQILAESTRHPDYERAMLAAQLSDLQRFLGEEDPLVRALLGMRTCDAAAGDLINRTVMNDRAALEAMLDGAPGVIASTSDPIVQGLDGLLPRLIRMQMASDVAFGREADAVARLARAVYDVYGDSIPPDATSSLRIQDGVVTGYPYNGTRAPVYTTFYGLYDRWASNGKVYPWALPERWQNPPPEFDLDTPLNFVSTCDIIGGNSGSPVLNTELEIVGIAFDGNIESLPGDYIFLPEINRCVSVHSAGVFEAIRDLFGYTTLAAELQNGTPPPDGE